MSIETRVKQVLCAQLDVTQDAVDDDAKIAEDLKADSLDTVELIMALEEEFDMEIPDEDAENIVTVGDAVGYIKDHMSGKLDE